MSITGNYFAKTIIVFALGLSVIGCSELQVKKIKPGEDDGGLAYCLAVPKLQVTTKEALIYEQGERLSGPPYASAARSIKEVTVTLVHVPSYEHYYSAKLKSGWFSSDSYTIGYDTNGCLSTYNFTTVEQTGTVFTTLASIAVAAAAIAAGEEPRVTYPEPARATYENEWESAQVLKKADEKINSLLSKPLPLTDQEQQQLSSLLESAAKLRTLLNPTPIRVIETDYVDLHFLPDGLTADEYVVREVLKAEKEQPTNCKGFIPCKDGNPVTSFIVGTARRLR